MKAVRRRLGILAICIALVLVSVSLGTWVTKRRGEMGTVGWSPLFESRERRALTPLRTIEAMAQGKPTEQCQQTADCQQETSDCEPDETAAGADCETADTTCSCETWDDTCDCTGTCDEPDCETYCDPACFYRDFRLATVGITCDHTCTGETCDSDCVETLEGATCDGTCADETCGGIYGCFHLATVDATCYCVTFGATCYSDDPECVDTVGETCDCPLVIEGYGWLLTWFDTCDACETLDVTCGGTCIETCDCGFDTLDITCECKTWAGDTCNCETVPCITLDCSDTRDCPTYGDATCDCDTIDAETCDGEDPDCWPTSDRTCDEACETP